MYVTMANEILFRVCARVCGRLCARLVVCGEIRTFVYTRLTADDVDSASEGKGRASPGSLCTSSITSMPSAAPKGESSTALAAGTRAPGKR